MKAPENRIFRLQGLRTGYATVLLIFLLALFATFPAKAQCSASDVAPERLAKLARGFNLTGWLDGGNRVPPRSLLKTLRLFGFANVRLPIAAELFMPSYSTADAISVMFRSLDDALSTLQALGFAVSVDLHPGAKFQALHKADPEAALKQLIDFWGVAANRLRDHSTRSVFFEILNEPVIDAPAWRLQASKVIDVIRDVTPDRTIIYGIAGASRFDDLASSSPLLKPNVVYAVHYYDPFVFTHQGMTWDDSIPLRFVAGVPFPSTTNDPIVKNVTEKLRSEGHEVAASEVASAYERPWTAGRIAADVAQLAAWGIRHKVPTLINEFGVLKFAAPVADRIAWIRSVRTAAERACIGWAHWEFADAFGFVNLDGTNPDIDLPLVEALLATQVRN